jgi:hypothetical protein
VKPPASRAWEHESNVVFDEEVLYQERFTDPQTGIMPLRLTTLPFGNAHIYPEAPVSSPDGQRFIFARHHPPCGFCTFWIADLTTLAIRQITDEPNVRPPAIAPDGSAIYYFSGNTLWHMSPASFEREPIHEVPASFALASWISTVSHCGSRLAVAWMSPDQGGVIVIDLATGESRSIYARKDIRNAHAQYCRGPGNLLLIQVNDGMERDSDGNLLRFTGDLGGHLEVIDDGGADVREIGIGRTPHERIQGHQCWLGQGHTVISTTHWREKVTDPWRQNRIVTATADADSHHVICEGGEEAFTHVHTTLDGRFWVSDCNRTARIYVGSVRTGRFKLFCDSGASFGAHQTTHPHPFFLGDGKSVGWNSDITGVTQVYVARIPEGYLDDLES